MLIRTPRNCASEFQFKLEIFLISLRLSLIIQSNAYYDKYAAYTSQL